MHGNLGTSITSRPAPVTYEIRNRFPATVELALGGDDLRGRLRRPARLLRGEAVRLRWFDHGSLLASLIGISIPIFFLGLILKYVFSVQARTGCPASGARTSSRTRSHPTNFYILDAIIEGDPAAFWDAIQHLILPAIALGSIPLAIITRITRASVLDVQNEDYVRTARAKGLRAARGRLAARAAERAAAGLDDHRPPDRPPALGRRPDRDDLRLARHRQLARRTRSSTATTPCCRAGSSSSRSSSCRQPARGHLVRAPQPADPAVADVTVAEIDAASSCSSLERRPLARRLVAPAPNPAAIVGCFLVGSFVVIAIFAPLLAPYAPKPQNLNCDRDGLLPRAVRAALVRRRPARPRRASAGSSTARATRS